MPRSLLEATVVSGIVCLVAASQAMAAPPVSVVGWGPRSFADLAKRVAPAVVNIDVVREVASFPFFGKGGHVIQKGVGSGFVIDPNGLIVTNEHVVEGRSEMTVTFSDGRRLKGKVLGYDSIVDLALVKVHAGHLPALKLADSDQAEVGDWVEAFGSPLGLQKTVTVGILSAVNREFSQAERQSYLQTDAAINPGNSGGPLVLLNGEVVGMNTFIAQGAQGIGFAIPSNTITAAIAQIKAHGTVAPAWLGTMVARITPELARYLGVAAGKGIVIVQVTGGGPAQQAGLQAGDILLEADGHHLSDPQQLVSLLRHKRAGQSIRLLVQRSGQRKTIAVRLGAASPSAPTLPE